jgi:hypothetical protein
LWELAGVQGARGSAGQVRSTLPLHNIEMAEWLGISESHYKQMRGAPRSWRSAKRWETLRRPRTVNFGCLRAAPDLDGGFFSTLFVFWLLAFCGNSAKSGFRHGQL